MFIVGIDVAKRSHEVCMITSDGQTVQRPFSIRNNCTGYNLMLEKIRKHTNIKSQIVFAMESTAHYWLALFTRLRKDGYHVILLNPIQTSAMRDMFIRKIKTDAKDSFIIAELIRFGRYAESNVAQDRLLALKELCRNRFYLVDMAGDLKRKLIALIDRVFPEYEAQFDTIFCKSSVAVLKKYPTPQKLSNIFSATKSIVGLLVGIAYDEGFIESLDDKVSKYLPEFGEGDKITIRNLLTMSSGLDWDEAYTALISKTTQAYYGDRIRDLIMDLKVVEEPGKKYSYKSGDTQLLSFVLEAALDKVHKEKEYEWGIFKTEVKVHSPVSISEYAERKLWKPLGACNDALWNLDREDGDEKTYCCFNTTARDLARTFDSE